MSPDTTDDTTEEIPATGAWRPGQPVASRRFLRVAGEMTRRGSDPDGLEHSGTSRFLRLEGGGRLDVVDVAYETWGTLAGDGANAVLICHALTGDAHVAGSSGPGQPTPGWWDALVGPGRAVDTDRWFVVCSNVLGGCQGSTGPSSVAPDGRPHGSRFPVVTIRDMVRVQAMLADHLGIGRWRAVLGGSMGGMQALEWATMFPERVERLVLASTTAAASAQQIAWSHIGRRAVAADPRFRGGDYYDAEPGDGPHRGLAVARMCAQVTYRSDEVFTDRFHRTTLGPMEFTLDPIFDVEGYLDYHGLKLARRFDANSYMRLNRAMDLHDVARGRGSTEAALSRITAPALVAAVRSDGLYPPIQQHVLADGLASVGGDVTWVDIDSPHGHDGFLIETPQLAPPVRDFLERP